MENYQEIHIEQDFWDDFIVEAFEHIDAIESNAMSLEQNPENMDIIHTMFRAFHTIKGLSGFVEHSIIQEIAHKTETMMDYCRKGELSVTTQIVDAILKSSDYIKQLCETIDAYKDEDLINRIKTLLEVLESISNSGEKEISVPVEIKEEIPAVQEQVESTTFEEKLECETQTEELDVQQVPQEEPQAEISLEAFANSIPEPSEAEALPENSSEILPEENFEAEIEVREEVFAEEESDETQENAEEKSEAELTQEEKELKSFQNSVIEKLKNEPKPQEKQRESSIQKAPSANEEYMKVANSKIDHLVDMIGELIINQSLIEQYVFSKYSEDRDLVTNMSGFLRTTRDLQNLSMSLRMVSLKPTFQKVTRIARDTIQELGKEVEFITSGENTEIDRVVAEKLLDPLVHLIKNAISHGVEEKPDDRVQIGKNRKARVELNAYSKRGKIFIEIKDDGRGINTEIVYQKAIEKNLIDTNRTYSEAEIKEFIMLPGFSTAKVVDNISGRGVGMDVVQTQIVKIGGKVEIQSELNKGSTFTLEVPVNHAIMNGTIIEMNKQQFVVPTVNVKEFLQPLDEQWIFTREERTMIKVRDNIIPLVPLSVFFKGVKDESSVPLVMILELDNELRAVPITNVINRQEVVVKPVSEEFSHLKYISGMSILGTGRVSLILDIDYLFRKEVKE